MLTVIDQVKPWLRPSRTFAATTHPQDGAQASAKGTGIPISQPATRSCLRRKRAVSVPAARFVRAHDLRHTRLTWFADAGVQVHVLRRIAGHGSLTTTQRYLHPDLHKITAAGAALSAYFSVLRAPRSLPSPTS